MPVYANNFVILTYKKLPELNIKIDKIITNNITCILIIKKLKRKGDKLMANKNKKRHLGEETIEDTTMYGEFISSFHQWQTQDRQSRKARYLEEVTEEFTGDTKDFNTKSDK